MKIIFLGTNGWYPSKTGDTPCVLIDAQDHYVVFDAGNGIYKLDTYIKESKPISLFISHFHLDHVSGLHILSKFNFKQGVDVYVGEGRVKDFDTLVNPPFTVGYEPNPNNIVDLKTLIRLHELSEKGEAPSFKTTTIELPHAYRNHGFVVELENKRIAYTGDCGYGGEVKTLAAGVDVLICECGSKKVSAESPWKHFDPYQAAKLAKESGVKQLILNHFGANEYVTLEDRTWAEEEAKKIFPNTIAAKDEFIFEL